MSSGSPPSPWNMLGIERTNEIAAIRRAYAVKLKAIDVEADPEVFIALRGALESALAEVQGRSRWIPGNSLAGEALPIVATSEPEVAPAPRSSPPHEQPEASKQPPPTGQAPPPDPPEAPSPPRARSPQAAPPEQPEIDPEDFARIERMLFGENPYDADALGDAASALFAHPALDRIVVAESVQNWAVDMIVNAAPRSDPLIEPAITRFGWDKNAGDWRRPPVLDWIIERRRDSQFERDLIACDPKYADVLATLRASGPPTEKPKWTVADGVRAFLFHARLQNPTSIALCDRDALAWWDAFVTSPPFPYGTFGGLVRYWFDRDDPYHIFGTLHSVSARRIVGAIMLPVIFAWPLLRPLNPRSVRIVASLWLLIFSAGIYFAPPLPEVPPSPGHGTALTTPEIDLNPIVSRITHGRLNMSGLQSSNPRLYGQLVDSWAISQTRSSYLSSVDRQTVYLMENFYRDALRAAPSAIQTEYWRVKIDELNWLRQYGGRFCAQVVRDQGYANSYRFPAELRERAMAVRVSIWRSVSEAPPPHSETVPIPADIAAAAARRAHLEPRAFSTAMRGDGSDETLCAAKIALVETVLARPPAESAHLLRDLTLIE